MKNRDAHEPMNLPLGVDSEVLQIRHQERRAERPRIRADFVSLPDSIARRSTLESRHKNTPDHSLMYTPSFDTHKDFVN